MIFVVVCVCGAGVAIALLSRDRESGELSVSRQQLTRHLRLVAYVVTFVVLNIPRYVSACYACTVLQLTSFLPEFQSTYSLRTYVRTYFLPVIPSSIPSSILPYSAWSIERLNLATRTSTSSRLHKPWHHPPKVWSTPSFTALLRSSSNHGERVSRKASA